MSYFVAPSPSCELYYNSSEAVCYRFGSIGRDYVFLNGTNTIDDLNEKLGNFLNGLNSKVNADNSLSECTEIISTLMCHNLFPLCDYSSNIPRPRQVGMHYNTSSVCMNLLFYCRSAGLTVKK